VAEAAEAIEVVAAAEAAAEAGTETEVVERRRNLSMACCNCATSCMSEFTRATLRRSASHSANTVASRLAAVRACSTRARSHSPSTLSTSVTLPVTSLRRTRESSEALRDTKKSSLSTVPLSSSNEWKEYTDPASEGGRVTAELCGTNTTGVDSAAVENDAASGVCSGSRTLAPSVTLGLHG